MKLEKKNKFQNKTSFCSFHNFLNIQIYPIENKVILSKGECISHCEKKQIYLQFNFLRTNKNESSQKILSNEVHVTIRARKQQLYTHTHNKIKQRIGIAHTNPKTANVSPQEKCKWYMMSGTMLTVFVRFFWHMNHFRERIYI